MNITDMHSALTTMLNRGIDPRTEVVVNCNAFDRDVPEWAIVQGVGDPTMPMFTEYPEPDDDTPADWIWVTLHLIDPTEHAVIPADCRFTHTHEGTVRA